jgi:hypothetical protein
MLRKGKSMYSIAHGTGMLRFDISLPSEINARLRIQSADIDALNYLCWRGFQLESGRFGGYYVMRRDFHDGVWANYPEPPPPRFPIHVL